MRYPANRAADPFGGGIALALFAALLTGAGFFRSFFSDPAALDGWHLLHGVVASGWVLLVLAQAGLIRARNYRVHRILGWSSLALFAVLVVTSLKLVVTMLAGQSGMPFELAKLLAFSDLATLPLLVLLYGAALALRRDRHVHSRLISGTLLVGMIPAGGRVFAQYFPMFGGLAGALHPTYLLVLALLCLAIVADWRKGALRWPFPLMLAWFALVYASLFAGSASHWFDQAARAIAGRPGETKDQAIP